MKSFVVALALALFPLAASAASVTTDSDPSVNLASYKTYYWAQKPSSGAPLMDQRIVADVDAQLQAKGFTLAADGDIALSANVSTTEKQSLDTFYTGPAMGGWGWRGGWGGRGWGMGMQGMGGMGMADTTTTVNNYEVGTLVVDMFDTKTKEAIWRGTASGAVPSSMTRQNKVVDSSIVKMFAKFPASAAK